MENNENIGSKIIFESEGNFKFDEKLEEIISTLKFLNNSVYLGLTYLEEIDCQAFITGYDLVFKNVIDNLEDLLTKESNL